MRWHSVEKFIKFVWFCQGFCEGGSLSERFWPEAKTSTYFVINSISLFSSLVPKIFLFHYCQFPVCLRQSLSTVQVFLGVFYLDPFHSLKSGQHAGIIILGVFNEYSQLGLTSNVWFLLKSACLLDTFVIHSQFIFPTLVNLRILTKSQGLNWRELLVGGSEMAQTSVPPICMNSLSLALPNF